METVTPSVVTVGQLNSYIKSLVDSDYRLKHIFLCGEISNFTNHLRTGHFYMTLKDDKASVKAVMFCSYAERLRFMPENGMKVLVYGSVSVFERDGQYQFYIENMQPDGLGSLNLAFEQLKEKLEKEGLFSVSHKKKLPRYPKVVGVITSPTGAAFQDIKNVLGRRWPLAEIRLCATQVQGDTAPSQIVSAIHQMASERVADVIIVARGGGSIEDLWAFNDERVARAIFDCSIPVISGVGHETDFTIADFVADMRAPTPSAAAELAVPDAISELQQISQLRLRTQRIMLGKITADRTKLSQITSRNVMQGPVQLINERRLMLDSTLDKMNWYMKNKTAENRASLTALAGKLDAYSPLKVLSRGYNVATASNTGRLIKSVTDVSVGDRMHVTMTDGTIIATVEEKLL